jgi:D-alanyl-D-alanine carboxypeptidase
MAGIFGVFGVKNDEFQQFVGRSSEHIDFESLEQPVHKQLVAPLLALKAAASAVGFDLRVASGFRSFDRQLNIWNAKATGARPLLDSAGCLLDPTCLLPEQVMMAILRWSALPGGSRHHWGCEIDIYDAAAVAGDYRLLLEPSESEGDGPFTKMHRWLDGYLPSTDFYRPYAKDTGGVAPEPWHLSYAPLAEQYSNSFEQQQLFELLQSTDIALKPQILAHLDMIVTRFMCLPCGNSSESWV